MKSALNKPICLLAVPTAEGRFLAKYSRRGLCRLGFPSSGAGADSKVNEASTPEEVRRWHAATVSALASALSGRKPNFLPPLDLSAGTDFQRLVWQTLCRIDCGATWTYAEVARAIGKPAALRAVGNACGANPIPVLVPCHRVVAANHALGGFSAGLDWKRKLLAREGSWPNERLLF